MQRPPPLQLDTAVLLQALRGQPGHGLALALPGSAHSGLVSDSLCACAGRFEAAGGEGGEVEGGRAGGERGESGGVSDSRMKYVE